MSFVADPYSAAMQASRHALGAAKTDWVRGQIGPGNNFKGHGKTQDRPLTNLPRIAAAERGGRAGRAIFHPPIGLLRRAPKGVLRGSAAPEFQTT